MILVLHILRSSLIKCILIHMRIVGSGVLVLGVAIVWVISVTLAVHTLLVRWITVLLLLVAMLVVILSRVMVLGEPGVSGSIIILVNLSRRVIARKVWVHVIPRIILWISLRWKLRRELSVGNELVRWRYSD